MRKIDAVYSLLGILPPSSGEVLVKNENPYKYDVKQMVRFQRSTVGIIYQSFNLIPSLSVLDNVTLAAYFCQYPEGRARPAGDAPSRNVLALISRHINFQPIFPEANPSAWRSRGRS